MKKNMFILGILWLFSLSSNSLQAQTKTEVSSEINPTNQEEYNYLTTGYKFQLENGLDMKMGYKLEDITSPNVGGITCVIKALFRENENKPCAFLCIVNRPSDKVYVCIPSYNAEKSLWDQFYAKISPLADATQNALIYSISRLAAKYANK